MRNISRIVPVSAIRMAWKRYAVRNNNNERNSIIFALRVKAFFIGMWNVCSGFVFLNVIV